MNPNSTIMPTFLRLSLSSFFYKIVLTLGSYGDSLVAQMIENPSAMWETWVESLGWEDPLEKGTAIHSRILAWRIPWTV